MTAIVVTGGAGFIGSNFIFYIRKKYPEYKIVCIDSLTYAGNINTLLPIMNDSNFRFYRCNICDKESISNIFDKEQPDYVVNFAAETHVDRSIENPKMFLETNIIGTSVLMDECLKHNVKRFHQVSTDEVYGDLPLDKPELKFDENTHLHTSSPYSSSKAGADLLVMAYVRTYGLDATITRCSNNYGPYQFPEKLIPLMIAHIQNNKKLPVYGRGINVRDWLYVEDHCNAIDLVIHCGKKGEIYNVGANNEMKNIDVVNLLLKLLNGDKKLITFVDDRKGHDLRYAINSSKIKYELGWEPKVSFDDGIEYTIKWYSNNKKWMDSISSKKYIKDNTKNL